MVAGEPLPVQVMHLGAMPLRLTTDMTVGYIDPYEGPSYEVSPDELKERDRTAKEEKESPLPGVDASSVPEEWSRAHRALMEKHVPLWGGNLGLIPGACVNIWHSHMMERYTGIYSDSGNTSPIMCTFI